MTQAIQEFTELDKQAEKSSDIFLDYLTFIMSQHLAEEQRQTEAHNWNPDQSVAENFLREHMPYTYLAWIFSGLSEEELFFGPRTVRRVTISGPVDVEVWLDDHLVRGVDMQGNVYSSEDTDQFADTESLDDFFDRYLNVFLMRNNEDTVTCLPVDKNFRILIRAAQPSSINYYDVFWNPAETLGSSDKIHTGNVSEGEYVLDVSHDLPLIILPSIIMCSLFFPRVSLPQRMRWRLSRTADHQAAKDISTDTMLPGRPGSREPQRWECTIGA